MSRCSWLGPLLVVMGCGGPTAAHDAGDGGIVDASNVDGESAVVDAEPVDAAVPVMEIEWDRKLVTGSDQQLQHLEGAVCGGNRIYVVARGSVLALGADGEELARRDEWPLRPDGLPPISAGALDADEAGLTVIYSPYVSSVETGDTFLAQDYGPDLSLGRAVEFPDPVTAGVRATDGSLIFLTDHPGGPTQPVKTLRLTTIDPAGQLVESILETSGGVWLSARGLVELASGNLLACVSNGLVAEPAGRVIEIDPVARTIVSSLYIGNGKDCELIRVTWGASSLVSNFVLWTFRTETELQQRAGRLNSAGDLWGAGPKTVRSILSGDGAPEPFWQFYQGTLYLSRIGWHLERIDALSLTPRGFVKVPKPTMATGLPVAPTIISCMDSLYLVYEMYNPVPEVHLAKVGTIPE